MCIPESYGFSLSGSGNISGVGSFQGRIDETQSNFVIDEYLFIGPAEMAVFAHDVLTGTNVDSYYYAAFYLYYLSNMTFTGTVDRTEGTFTFPR